MNFLQTHPTITYLRGFEITAHGLFFALGAFIATIYLCKYAHDFGLRVSQVVDKSLGIFIVGLLAARLGYLLAYPDAWNSGGDIIAIWHGGLVSFTGIIGGLGMSYFLSRSMNAEQKQQWFSALVRAGLLGWAIGRLGNYYAGESGGVASSMWAATYGHIPIQLFEALGCFVLFILLHVKRFAAYQTFVIGVGGYLCLRFIVDFWRDELVVGLRVSQWVSLLCISIVALYAFFRRRH